MKRQFSIQFYSSYDIVINKQGANSCIRESDFRIKRSPVAKERDMTVKRVWAGLILFLILLEGCGNNNPSQVSLDTMSVTIEKSGKEPDTTTYTEGPFDPVLTGFSEAGRTGINLCFGTLGGGCAEVFVDIRLIADRAGAYSTNDNNFIVYQAGASDLSTYQSIQRMGTITLSSVGGISQKITGSFDTIAELISQRANTIRLSGSFSVTRQ